MILEDLATLQRVTGVEFSPDLNAGSLFQWEWAFPGVLGVGQLARECWGGS